MGVIRYFVVEDTKLPLKSVVPVWLLRRYPKLQNSQSHLVDSTCLHFGTFVLGNIQLAVTICKEFSGWHRPSHGVEKLIEIFSIVMKHQEKEEKKAFILEIARGGSLSAAVGSRRKLIKKWVLGCGVGLAAAVVMFSVFSLWQWRGSGDDTPVVSVAIAGLAVLPPGFERSLQNPFTATKLPEAGTLFLKFLLLSVLYAKYHCCIELDFVMSSSIQLSGMWTEMIHHILAPQAISGVLMHSFA